MLFFVTALFLLLSPVLSQELEGGFKAVSGLSSIGAGCDYYAYFFQNSYVSYAVGTDCSALYSGTFVVDPEEGVLSVFYALSQNEPGSFASRGTWANFDYSFQQNGNLILSNTEDPQNTILIAYEPLTDNPDIDGVWTTSQTGGVTASVQIVSGGLYLAIADIGSGYTITTCGFIDVSDENDVSIQFAANTFMDSDESYSDGNPVKTIDNLYGGVLTQDSGSFTLVFPNLTINFVEQIPETALEGVWTGQNSAVDCLITIEFTSNIFRAYNSLCSGEDVQATGMFLGTFELSGTDDLILSYAYAPSTNGALNNVVADFTYTINGNLLDLSHAASSFIPEFSSTLVSLDANPIYGIYYIIIEQPASFDEEAFEVDLADQLGISRVLVGVETYETDLTGSSVASFTVTASGVTVRIIEDLVNAITIDDITTLLEGITEINGYPVLSTSLISVVDGSSATSLAVPVAALAVAACLTL